MNDRLRGWKYVEKEKSTKLLQEFGVKKERCVIIDIVAKGRATIYIDQLTFADIVRLGDYHER